VSRSRLTALLPAVTYHTSHCEQSEAISTITRDCFVVTTPRSDILYQSLRAERSNLVYVPDNKGDTPLYPRSKGAPLPLDTPKRCEGQLLADVIFTFEWVVLSGHYSTLSYDCFRVALISTCHCFSLLSLRAERSNLYRQETAQDS